MSSELDPFGAEVPLDGTSGFLLRTPGLKGTADLYGPDADGVEGLRAAGGAARATTHLLEEALQNGNVQPQATIVIDSPQEVPLRGAAGEPVIEAEVPAPNECFGQLVLAVDEWGVVTWHFAEPSGGTAGVSRGTETRTYRIPHYAVSPPPGERLAPTRGLASAAGKKLLKVLLFPIVEKLIGRVDEYFARNWEEKNAPYRVRTFTPEDFSRPGGTPLAPEAWRGLSAGRALLLVHGTFSRTHTAFRSLEPDTVRKLHGIYGGRVFAFDHPTLSEDPEQNAHWLIQEIPDGTQLDLDIVCHSRGGLVSRMLAERASCLGLGSRRLTVRRVVFVGVPNAGTALTDDRYIGDLLDAYTNLLNFFPDNGVTEVLAGIVTAAKMIAVGALKGLPGLQAMRPGGEFLKKFSSAAPRMEDGYRALASDFEPHTPGLVEWSKNRLMDRVFQQAANDLVVPTEGVYAVDGCSGFPIAERYVFGREQGISHTGYFGNPEAQSRIVHWLS